MVVGERKPLAEIMEMVRPYKKILVAGCETCTAESMSGGRKQVAELAAALEMAFRLEGKEMEIREISVDRQCIHEFLLENLAVGARSTVQEYLDRLLETPAAGAGAGSFSILIGATASHLAPERRSFAAGFVNAGGSLGQFVFALLNQAIISTFGWMQAMWTMAVIALGTAPAALWLRGGVQLVGADGFRYEVRNRMTLCRCGKSTTRWLPRKGRRLPGPGKTHLAP